MWAWGRNDYGQLGDGTTISPRTQPAQVGSYDDWDQVASGFLHSAGIRQDGSLWAWGQNEYGNLGTTGPFLSGTQISVATTDTSWVLVSVGARHTLALNDDGTLWAFGSNTRGELGDGDRILSRRPLQLQSSADWVLAGIGSEHNLAVKTDGSLWTWGLNDYGQLGMGTVGNKNTPIHISDGWSGISGGGSFSLGAKTDGSLWAWGENLQGQCGTSGGSQAAPFRIGQESTWSDPVSGGSFGLARKNTDELWGWGDNLSAQLGTDPSELYFLTPIPVHPTVSDWLQISAGANHTLSILTDNSLWAWGGNGSGQLGSGTAGSPSSALIQEATADTSWSEIAAGASHSLAIRQDGSLWAWGDNGSGQLGTTTAGAQQVPVRVGTDSDWVDLAAGYTHSLGIQTDGSLWAWGSNFQGQLGTASGNQFTPVQVAVADTTWAAVTAGYQHTLALKEDGSLWYWGTLVQEHASVPEQVMPGTTDWTAISSGGEHVMALRPGGSLYVWGDNRFGQLGDGEGFIYTPQRVLH
jgi:alpha-tubulin suppressor-like RCC1 family protein